MNILLGITLGVFIVFFLFPYLENIYIYIRLYFIFKKISRNQTQEIKDKMLDLTEKMKDLIKNEEI